MHRHRAEQSEKGQLCRQGGRLICGVDGVVCVCQGLERESNRTDKQTDSPLCQWRSRLCAAAARCCGASVDAVLPTFPLKRNTAVKKQYRAKDRYTSKCWHSGWTSLSTFLLSFLFILHSLPLTVCFSWWENGHISPSTAYRSGAFNKADKPVFGWCNGTWLLK